MPPPSAVRIEAELVDEGGDAAVGLTLVGAEPSELVTFVDHPARRQHVHRITALDVDLRRRHDDLHGRRSRPAATPSPPPASSGTNAETTFHLDPPD